MRSLECYFGVYFPRCWATREINIKNNTRVSAKSICHARTYIILYIFYTHIYIFGTRVHLLILNIIVMPRVSTTKQLWYLNICRNCFVCNLIINHVLFKKIKVIFFVSNNIIYVGVKIFSQCMYYPQGRSLRLPMPCVFKTTIFVLILTKFMV